MKIDIDECSRGLDRCDLNAQCINEFGHYTCSCEEGNIYVKILAFKCTTLNGGDLGYKGDGWTCSLMDFTSEEIIQITYKNRTQSETTAYLKSSFLDDNVVFDWGNETITLTKGPALAGASINSLSSGGCIRCRCAHRFRLIFF